MVPSDGALREASGARAVHGLLALIAAAVLRGAAAKAPSVARKAKGVRRRPCS